MPVNDQLADLLARLKNASTRGHQQVVLPHSRLKLQLARILKEEGYLKSYEVIESGGHQALRLTLKYRGERGESAITDLKRVSKPGIRVYVDKEHLPRVQDGLGIAVLSTSQGVMTEARARELGVGGEVLCHIW